MNLKLNNPPSFRKPMSVIVVGLPAIEAAQLPPLRPVNADQVFCLQKSSLVLPVEGAPLGLLRGYCARFLSASPEQGWQRDRAARAGGCFERRICDRHARVEAAKLDAEVTGTLHGFWGFEPYEGPNFRLRTSRAAQWALPASEQSALIVGREDSFHLQSECASAWMTSKFEDGQGKEIKTTWKLTKPEELELKVALKDQPAGPMKMRLGNSV